jgi:Domain of unknown function (DUF4915)
MTPTLIASGFGADGGGLFKLTSGRFDRIDQLETVGLAVSPSGDRLARALVGYLDGSAPAHVLLYDASGVVWYRRIEGVHDVHGVVWTSEDELAIVSTSTNTVLRLDADGLPGRAVRFAEAVDAWHLNCPALDHAGRLVVTAFSQTDAEQGWRPLLRAGERTGVLLDVDAGSVRFGALHGPHDPLALPGGGWLVCDSASGALIETDGDGRVLRTAALGGWTRGLTLGEDGSAYVGVSTRRHEGEAGRAQVVRLDLASFTELQRWSLGCDEVFALAWAEDPLLRGLIRGFGALPGFGA